MCLVYIPGATITGNVEDFAGQKARSSSCYQMVPEHGDVTAEPWAGEAVELPEWPKMLTFGQSDTVFASSETGRAQ